MTEERFRYDIQRQSLVGLEPDPAALLDRALAELEAKVLQDRPVVPRLRWFLADAVETGSVPNDDDEQQMLARLFVLLTARDGVVLAVREERVEIDLGSGPVAHVAVLAVSPEGIQAAVAAGDNDLEDVAWELALGRIDDTPGEAPRIPRWERVRGQGRGALPEPFALWLIAEGARYARIEAEEQDVGADADIRLSVGELAAPPPGDINGLLMGVAEMVDIEVAERGIDAILLFALDERTIQRWEFRGQLPCPLDDLARNVSAMGPVLGMVVVQVGTIELEGKRQRALVSQGEIGRMRGLRWLPLHEDENRFTGEAGRIVTTELPPGQGWIGVAPSVELGLSPTGTMWSSSAIAEA